MVVPQSNNQMTIAVPSIDDFEVREFKNDYQHSLSGKSNDKLTNIQVKVESDGQRPPGLIASLGVTKLGITEADLIIKGDNIELDINAKPMAWMVEGDDYTPLTMVIAGPDKGTVSFDYDRVTGKSLDDLAFLEQVVQSGVKEEPAAIRAALEHHFDLARQAITENQEVLHALSEQLAGSVEYRKKESKDLLATLDKAIEELSQTQLPTTYDQAKGEAKGNEASRT